VEEKVAGAEEAEMIGVTQENNSLLDGWDDVEDEEEVEAEGDGLDEVDRIAMNTSAHDFYSPDGSDPSRSSSSSCGSYDRNDSNSDNGTPSKKRKAGGGGSNRRKSREFVSPRGSKSGGLLGDIISPDGADISSPLCRDGNVSSDLAGDALDDDDGNREMMMSISPTTSHADKSPSPTLSTTSKSIIFSPNTNDTDSMADDADFDETDVTMDTTMNNTSRSRSRSRNRNRSRIDSDLDLSQTHELEGNLNNMLKKLEEDAANEENDDYGAIMADPTVELEGSLAGMLKNTARRKSIAFAKSRLSMLPGRITIKTVCELAKIDLDKSGEDTFKNSCHFFPTVLAIEDICGGKREFSGALARENKSTLEEAIEEAGQGGAGEEWDEDCIIELSKMLVEKDGLQAVLNEGENGGSELQKLGAAVTSVVLSEWEKWDAALLSVLSARIDDLIIEVKQESETTREKLQEAKNLAVAGESDSNKKIVQRDRRRRFNECTEKIRLLGEEIELLERDLVASANKQEVIRSITEYSNALLKQKEAGKEGVDSQRTFLMLKDLLSFRTTELNANRIGVCLDGGTHLPAVNLAWRVDSENGLVSLMREEVLDENTSTSRSVNVQLFRLLSKRSWLRKAKLMGEHPAHELNDRLDLACKIVGRMHMACIDIEKVFKDGENDVEVWGSDNGDINVKITFVTSTTKCWLCFVYVNNLEGVLSVLPTTCKFDVVIGKLPDTKEFVEMAAIEELQLQKRARVGSGFYVVKNTFEAVVKMLDF